MESRTYDQAVSDIMERFARKTGMISSGHKPQRYLWTDAFAVCNFLELHCRTRQTRYLDLALDLVNQVHEILGKHRGDDIRTGWISGLAEPEVRRHPTAGGLRIGKKMGERKRDQAYDEQLEWDRDGQYYHYLTKWMHALHQVSARTNDPSYNRWAYELAKKAHAAFGHQDASGALKRLYWKMSIDLTYPLVSSMGHHDPLDGFVTFHEINWQSASQFGAETPCNLAIEIAELSKMCKQSSWVTADALGLGGLLFDAYRVLQMTAKQNGLIDHNILMALLKSSCQGLQVFLNHNNVRSDANARLAFRELGLAIGLHAVANMSAMLENIPTLGDDPRVQGMLQTLLTIAPLAETIEAFWLSPKNRKCESWLAHEDINMVMLATSLAPGGFLELKQSNQSDAS